MQQSDYILREIEKISIMLLGMLGKMVRRRKEGVELNEDEYSSFAEQLLSEATIEIGDLLQKSPSEFEDYFRTLKGFDEKNIELLADLITAMGDLVPEGNKLAYYLKALQIYQYLDISFKTFSFERIEKTRALQKILDLSAE